MKTGKPLYRQFLSRHGFLGFRWFRYGDGSIGYRVILAEEDRGIIVTPKLNALTGRSIKRFLGERTKESTCSR